MSAGTAWKRHPTRLAHPPQSTQGGSGSSTGNFVVTQRNWLATVGVLLVIVLVSVWKDAVHLDQRGAIQTTFEPEKHVDLKTQLENGIKEEEGVKEIVREEYVASEEQSSVSKDDQSSTVLTDERLETYSEDKSQQSVIEQPQYQGEGSEEEDEFEIPLDAQHLFRNGCPFGWHSPSIDHSYCFHVSLAQYPYDDANKKCLEMGAKHKMYAYLARIPSEDVNTLLCDILNRANNRFSSPDRLHIGLARLDAIDENDQMRFEWRDGTPFDMNSDFVPFSSQFNPRSDKNAKDKVVNLVCAGKLVKKWILESDAAIPFACMADKPARTEDPADIEAATQQLPGQRPDDSEEEREYVLQLQNREYNEDSFTFEQTDSETARWTSVAPWSTVTLQKCAVLAKEVDELGYAQKTHKNTMLSRLEPQIFWKLSDRRSKSEPKRYYMVWQSKSRLGWLDFWVEYLVKYRDFQGAPIGKYVTSSRAAKERLGYSSIFNNPSIAEKQAGGALVVLSRLPIPDNVLVYFPNGTLVNQLYVDPFARVPFGDKLELVQYLSRYARSKGCSDVGDLEIIPSSYDISTLIGCKRTLAMLNSLSNQKEIVWVLKGPKHGGAAISLLNAEQIKARIGTCSNEVLARHEFVQKLITKPLLLDGRKFDLRVFVLVARTQPILVYVHREPYYRATIKKYVTLTTPIDELKEKEKSRHVTNTHIQKVTRTNFTEKDWSDHLWPPEKVRMYATKAGLNSNFYAQLVFPKIKRALQNVFRATSVSLKDRRPGQWKLFGVDFLIDEELHPHLLDWNAFPGWDWSYRLQWTLEYRRRILSDCWRLVLDVQKGRDVADERPTPKTGGFELIYQTLK